MNPRSALSSDGVGSVAWPAIVLFDGEDKLLVVTDEDEWRLDPDLHAWSYGVSDRLIDSGGVEFRMVLAGSPGHGGIVIEPTGARREPAEVELLAERHLAAVGAPKEWLRVHLADVPGQSRIRAAIHYVARIEVDEESE